MSGEKLLLMLTKPDFHMKFYAWDAAHRKSDKLYTVERDII